MATPFVSPGFTPQETAQLIEFIGEPPRPLSELIPTPREESSAPSIEQTTATEPLLVAAEAFAEPAARRTQLDGAQQALIAHETSWLLKYCQKYTLDHAEVADIAQATVERFLRHGHTVDPQKIRSWLAITSPEYFPRQPPPE